MMTDFSEQIFKTVQPNQHVMTAYQTVLHGGTVTDFDALKQLYNDKLNQLPFNLRHTKWHLMNHQQRIVWLTTAFKFADYCLKQPLTTDLIRRCLLFKQSINADWNRYPPIWQFNDLKTTEQLIKYEDLMAKCNGNETTYVVYRQNNFELVTIDDLKAYFNNYLSLNVLTEIAMIQTVFETEPKSFNFDGF